MRIHLNLNTTVNPCITKTTGEYAPEQHQIYVTVDSTQKNLYNELGWYIGCFWIGCPELSEVTKKEFAGILRESEQKINLIVAGQTKQELREAFQTSVDIMLDVINTSFQKKGYQNINVQLTKHTTSYRFIESIIDKVVAAV